MQSIPHSRIISKSYFADQKKKKRLYFILVFIYTSIKVKSKRGRKKDCLTFLLVSTVIIHYIIFNLGEIVSEITANITTDKIPYNTFHTSQNTPQINSSKHDFAQSFSLAFTIRKNALILYSFSEEKEVQKRTFLPFYL